MPDTAVEYEVTIKPTRSWLHIDFKILWDYRDLLLLFIYRDFVAKYKQTVLGPLWFIIQPLLMTGVFTVIFGKVANIPTDDLPRPLFYLCGLLSWSYFAQSFGATSKIFTDNAGVFGKIFFPRALVPLSICISNLLALVLQVCTFLLFYIYFKYFTEAGSTFGVSVYLWCLPFLVFHLLLFSLGTGMWMSSLTAKYRDFSHLSVFLVQVLMYGTPVIYPMTQIPEKYVWFASLNPMMGIVETFRLMFLGQSSVTLGVYAVSVVITLFIFVSGFLLFNRVEKNVVDIV